MFNAQQTSVFSLPLLACWAATASVCKVNIATMLIEWVSEFSLINNLKHYVIIKRYESMRCSRLHCPALCNNHLVLHRIQTSACLSFRLVKQN